MYGEYLDEFMPSRMMRDYLKGVELKPWQIADLVYFSPKAITAKRTAFQKLQEQAEESGNDELMEECERYLWNLDEALRQIEPEGVFLVSLECFDEDAGECQTDSEAICGSIADVMEHEKNGLPAWYYENDAIHWLNAEKWNRDGGGRYYAACEYVIAGGEILYAELNDSLYKNDKVEGYGGGENLNLPVPFKAGDLLEFDGFPFGPKTHALIAGIGDNRDCCCVQALSRNGEGRWSLGAVKHGMIGHSYFPKVSPLYSVRVFDGILPEEDRLLLKAKEYIDADSGRAEWVQEWLPWINLTEEELLESLEKEPEELEREYREKYGGKMQSVIERCSRTA